MRFSMPENPIPDSGTLPALAPPSTMGEALLREIAYRPELQSRNFLARLRADVISVMNAALQSPAYMGHGSHAEMPDSLLLNVEKTRVQLPILKALALISDDLCLGLSYLCMKRGNEGVEEHLRKADTAMLVRIGKQLREVFQEQMHALGQRNTVLPPEKLKDGGEDPHSRPKLSHLLEIEMWSAPQKLLSYGNVLESKQRIDSFASYFALADQLQIGKPLCNSAYFDGLLEQAFEKVRENGQRFGFLELATFVEVFCKAHEAEPEDPLHIPQHLYPQFEECFVLEKGEWEWKEESRHILEEQCGMLFSDHPIALPCLRLILHCLPNALAENLQMPTELSRSSWEADRQYARGLFPQSAVLAEYKLFTPTGLAKADYENRGLHAERKEARNTQEMQVSLNTRPEEILQMERDEMLELAKRFPDPAEWHTLLLDTPEPGNIARVIMKLFEARTALCRDIAAHLLLFTLSMDNTICNRGWSIRDILQAKNTNPAKPGWREKPMNTGEEEVCTVLASKGSKALKIMQDLSPAFLVYFDKAFLEEDKLSVENVVESVCEDADIPRIFGMHYWHPNYRKGFVNVEDLGEALTLTESPMQQKCLDYIVRRQLLTTPSQWSLFVGDMRLRLPLAPKPPLLSKILASIPPEMLPEVALQQIVLQLSAHRTLKTLDDYREDERKKKKKPGKKIESIDIPMSVLLDPGTQEFALPPSWDEAVDFVEMLPERARTQLQQFLQARPDVYASSLYPKEFTKKHSSFVFTTKEQIDAEDLSVIQAICASPDHRLQKHVIAKALRSSQDIQILLLSEILQTEDASALALALIGNIARAMGDFSTIVSWRPQGWKSAVSLPGEYAWLADVLNASSALRQSVARLLMRHSAKCLTEL